MTDEEIIKQREKAEAYFRRHYPREVEKHLSDFGAYCVEQWLTGRHPRTSYHYLAADFLRSFAHRTRPCGDSSLDRSPGRLWFGPEADVELGLGRDSAELGRFIESSALRDPRLSERSRIILILFYEWGFNLKEIGDLLAVSESRTSQLLASALSQQKERIQAEVTRGETRARQPEESRAVSHQVQERPSLYRKANEIMERLRETEGERMGQTAIEEVSEALLGTFGLDTF